MIKKTLRQMLSPLISRLETKVGKHVIREKIRATAESTKTLDLGCGKSILADVATDRIGLDIKYQTSVDVVGDAHVLPFASGVFDQIICSEVLEHLKNPKQAVSEMARVLNDDGRLVVTVPFIYPVHEAPHDYQRFTEYGLKNLFASHFSIETIQPLYSEEQTLAILLQRVAYQRRSSSFTYYLYLALAHTIYKFSRVKEMPRYQDLGRTVSGAFLTADYLFVGKKNSAG